MGKRIPRVKKYLIHANNDLLCGVNLQTTGSDPGIHEIVHLTFYPVGAELTRLKDVPYLDLVIRPERPDMVSDKKRRAISQDLFLQALNHGVPKERAYELFTDWFHKLELQTGKRIIPITFDWVTKYRFFESFVGNDEYTTHKVRDLLTVASYQNDRADFDARDIPFPQCQRMVATIERMGVEVEKDLVTNSMYVTMKIVEAYRKMMFFERFF